MFSLTGSYLINIKTDTHIIKNSYFCYSNSFSIILPKISGQYPQPPPLVFSCVPSFPIPSRTHPDCCVCIFPCALVVWWRQITLAMYRRSTNFVRFCEQQGRPNKTNSIKQPWSNQIFFA
jgi:hypothetical protein